MNAPVAARVVEPMYRVLSGPCVGQVLPESQTVECDEDIETSHGYGCGGCGVQKASRAPEVATTEPAA